MINSLSFLNIINVIKKANLRRSAKYWSFTKTSWQYAQMPSDQAISFVVYFSPPKWKWQGLKSSKEGQTPKCQRLHPLNPWLNSTDLNKANMLLYKNLGRREFYLPIMSSWNSESRIPYWVYKLITSKKYTWKNPLSQNHAYIQKQVFLCMQRFPRRPQSLKQEIRCVFLVFLKNN